MLRLCQYVPIPLGLSLPSPTMFQFPVSCACSRCLFPCPAESPVGESPVTSPESQVTSRKYPVAEGLKHGAGRSVDITEAGTEFSGLQRLDDPTAIRLLVSTTALALPDLQETSPRRYSTLPARLTSSLVHLAGAHQPLSLLSTGNARPRIERGEDTSHGT